VQENHSLHLSSTLLRITGLQNDSSTHPGQTQEVPSNIKFSSSVSRYNDVGLMPPPRVPCRRRTLSRGATSPRDSEEPEKHTSTTMEVPDSQDALGQSSLVNIMNGDLKNMMQPEEITQGDTQTQGAFLQFAFEDAETVTPTSYRASSCRSSHFQTPMKTDTFPLLAGTQHEIAKRKPYLVETASALARKAGGRTADGQMVLCQCAFGNEEGEMVQCSYCTTWQHLHCYGYTGGEDPRLPEDHVCYWCLLGDTDVENYKNLQQLAVRRRAMFHVARSGLRTRTDFSKALGVGQDQASELHTMIKKSKFVTDAEKSHKPGYRATGKPLFVPAPDDATLRKLLETYFDPMTLVGHHYEARTAHDRVESEIQTNLRLIKGLAIDLPLPATPHRSKSKASAVSEQENFSSYQSTPLTSAHDMKASQDFAVTSETLLMTPSIKTRRQSQRNKRALDVEEAETRDSKRLATPINRLQFTSLRSSRMIDANDRSSPYMPQ
jgi:hypothetical protein